MNKYIRKKSGSYLKRGYHKRKFKIGNASMQDLYDFYVSSDWRIKTTVVTYKNK